MMTLLKNTFMILVETLEANNFIHYELSNLVKKIISKNNSLIG
jgi:hypothetical protein